MRRGNFWIDGLSQIQSRRRAVLVGQDLRARRDIRLSRNAIGRTNAAFRQSLSNSRHHVLVATQLEAEKLRHSFARDVVGGGSQSTRDNYNFGAREYFVERIANRCAIRNGALFVNPQPERKNFTGDENKMSILHI